MAASIFDMTGNPELRTLLGLEMEAQQWHQNRFAQWMAPNFVQSVKGKDVGTLGPNGKGFTGAPIEMQTAFIQEGRTDMLIPVNNRLTKAPVFGGVTLKGTAEPASYGFRSVSINETRKAYAPPTGMQKQKTKQWAKTLIGDARNQLKRHLSDWTAKSIQLAMCAGYSPDLTASAANGGLGQSYVSHPNFFVAGYGRVGIDPTTGTYTVGSRPGKSGYEAAVEAALNGLEASQARCSVSFIRAMVTEAARLKINPVVIDGGFEFYPIWLKDSQWNQLIVDPEFSSLAKSLHISALDKHPLGNGMGIYIAGAVLYPDKMLYCAYTNSDDSGITAGTVEYGPRPGTTYRNNGWKFNPEAGILDVGTKAVGILVGQSALTIGTGERLTFTEQMDDHENVQEIGYRMIQSIVRNETYDTLGLLSDNISGAKLSAGDFYENTSSLVFATYSPYTIAYN